MHLKVPLATFWVMAGLVAARHKLTRFESPDSSPPRRPSPPPPPSRPALNYGVRRSRGYCATQTDYGLVHPEMLL
ncbi:hypothetical protein K461DRAFT_283259 [Myriangium duriaei CBS 260.36]|uniref:Secreted protein n=1 Tax=Myriangium duriaei CBS 260.36 TaxID=1168546 RepID=A0A9P4ITU3_9PEZI|nr:hypothetical protein K461DRAFT_283259 [Myriangium duriaei CBS 260.36]